MTLGALTNLPMLLEHTDTVNPEPGPYIKQPNLKGSNEDTKILCRHYINAELARILQEMNEAESLSLELADNLSTQIAFAIVETACCVIPEKSTPLNCYSLSGIDKKFFLIQETLTLLRHLEG